VIVVVAACLRELLHLALQIANVEGDDGLLGLLSLRTGLVGVLD
jgi:hypothetical protein